MSTESPEGCDTAADLDEPGSPAALWRCKAFTHVTRRGKVLKRVREHYLRDDLGCGTVHRTGTEPLRIHRLPQPPVGAASATYLVLDTNVVLKQMDVLEHKSPDLSRVILLQTVLDEVRHQNASLLNRLMALAGSSSKQYVIFSNEHHRDTYVARLPGESPNDRNDRAIRVAAQWYQRNHGSEADILLLTNDQENRRLARTDGLSSESIHAYVKRIAADTYPELEDLLSGHESSGSDASGRARQRRRIFEPHLSVAAIAAGVRQGKYFQGTLRLNQYNTREGSVKVRNDALDYPIRLVGREALNRAFDGDVVAVELITGDVSPSGSGVTEASDPTFEDSEDSGAQIWDPATDSASDDKRAPSSSSAVSTGDGADAAATERRPHGRVVGIVRRSWRPFCGSIQPDESATQSFQCLFVPVKQNVPKIRIQTRQRAKLEGMRIIVAVDRWDVDSAYPTGHYVRTLGPVGDRETETQVVLIEHNIPTEEFSPAVMRCLPPKDWVVTDDKLDPSRKDLRDICVCSIDPPGCKDIDDALHARMLPDGTLECGVHIADVTHFVKPGSAIDLEAADRSTSTYLVDRRLDMLPGLLTTHLCSLRGNIDRFAFSVIWKLDPQTLEVKKVDFHKSVIHSRAALTYDQAQMMLDDSSATGDVPDAVRLLNRVATTLRSRRMEAGALTLASPEVRFKLDGESQDPTDVKMYELKQANALVEEFMLFANITVARRIVDVFPRYALLRRHPIPSPENFDGLLSAAACAGVKLKVGTSKELADSLDAAVRPDHPYFNKMLRIMATRCMSQAVYFCSGELSPAEYRHYGLATPIYTHFTSPIRRYADVIVHRLLTAAIGLEPLPDSYENKDHMRGLAENMNYRHRMAQAAGRASVALHTQLFFRDRPVEASACIMRVRPDSIVVLVPRFGIEAVVHILPRGADPETSRYTHVDSQQALIHADDPSLNLRVFDEVLVRIAVEDFGIYRQKLVVKLAQKHDGNAPVDATSVATVSGRKRSRQAAQDPAKSPPKQRRR